MEPCKKQGLGENGHKKQVKKDKTHKRIDPVSDDTKHSKNSLSLYNGIKHSNAKCKRKRLF